MQELLGGGPIKIEPYNNGPTLCLPTSPALLCVLSRIAYVSGGAVDADWIRSTSSQLLNLDIKASLYGVVFHRVDAVHWSGQLVRLTGIRIELLSTIKSYHLCMMSMAVLYVLFYKKIITDHTELRVSERICRTKKSHV